MNEYTNGMLDECRLINSFDKIQPVYLYNNVVVIVCMLREHKALALHLFIWVFSHARIHRALLRNNVAKKAETVYPRPNIV